MLIELGPVRQAPFVWSEELEIVVESLDQPQIHLLTPIACEGTLSFADPGFLLRLELAYQQTLICDRCLSDLVETVRTPVELLVLVRAGGASEAAVPDDQELDEQDLSVLTVSREELDTRPIVVEQIQLNLPMKPLCSADCRGLCPQCGANRNSEACECSEQRVDPRWAALEGLRDRLPS